MRRFFGIGAVLSVLAVAFATTKESITLTNIAATAGLHASIHCGGPEKRWIPEANGSGLAWLDYDNDGLMDLLIVNGSEMEQLRKTVGGQVPPPAKGGVYLFRNMGNGHFEDVTERAGLVNPYWGTGANATDYDNDGFTDILITTIGTDLLYHNNGNNTFTEVSKKSGLGQSVEWHTGSAFGDFDNDGFLDLYIAGYIDIHSLSLAEPAPVCQFENVPGFCGPIGLKPGRGVLYRNNGDGTFRDVSAQTGIASVKPAHSFTPVFDDFNQDGKIDLFIANDSDPNTLLLNQGNGTFKDAGLERGVAFNADGRVQSNMGVAVGDDTNDGRLSLITTTFAHDYYPVFRQDKSGNFEEISGSSGLMALTNQYLGWACGFADFDNDGHRELWAANGHVYPKASNYFQPFVIFRSQSHQFSLSIKYPATPAQSYRGGASADFNNDGRIDVAVLPIDGEPLMLRNETENRNQWIGLRLQGTKGNRDAIGAGVRVTACGETQFETVRNGGSYLSRNDPRLHFGLGSCGTLDRVTVRWPYGETQEAKNLKLNQYNLVVELK